jgi:ABC-type glutathione transport system ATPase component
VLHRGRLAEEGSWSEVCETPREAYTRQLVAATPELPRPDGAEAAGAPYR